jgi:prophage tail gpP-like protein
MTAPLAIGLSPFSVTVTPAGSTTPETVDKVLSWQTSQDIFTPADSWSVAIPTTRANRKLFVSGIKGSKIEVRIQGNLAITGLIDEISEDTGSSATDLHVSGRDMAGLLLDCCVPSDRLSISNANLLQLATRLSSDLWPQLIGAPVEDNGPSRYLLTGGNYRASKTSVGNEIQKKAFGKKSPFHSGTSNIRIRNDAIELGETIWPVLSELAQQVGVHLWMTCDGHLALARPGYNVDPGAYGSGIVLRWDGNRGGGNVLGVTFETSIAGRCSHYEVAGVSKSSRKALGRQILLDGGIILDPGAGFWTHPGDGTLGALKLYKPGVFRAATEDNQRLVRAARRMVVERALNAFSYEVIVRDFLSDSGAWWAPDTMVNVLDERNRISVPMYLTKVDRAMDATKGKTCKLKLIPPNLWLTDESEPQVPDATWTQAIASKMPW